MDNKASKVPLIKFKIRFPSNVEVRAIECHCFSSRQFFPRGLFEPIVFELRCHWSEWRGRDMSAKTSRLFAIILSFVYKKKTISENKITRF